MIKNYLFLFAFLFASVGSSLAQGNMKNKIDRMKDVIAAKQSKSEMLSFRPTAKSMQNGKHRVAQTPAMEMNDVYDFGTLTAEDGTTWFYSTKILPSSEYEYGYGGADITLYNSDNELVTTVNYTVPAGQYVNAIEPFGNISSKFYDNNSKTQEFTIFVHEVGPNYTSIGHFIVCNTQGEVVNQFEGGNIIWFDATEKWDTYQRAIFVSEGVDAEGHTTTKMSVMKPAGWNGTEPVEEHVFEVRDDLIEYSYGPCLNTYKVDGQPYYVLSYYEKPFAAGWDENYDIILSEDNHYVVEVYDRNYNKVSNFKVPVTHADDVYCSMYAMGLYSYSDLRKGYYTGDDKLNVVITRTDVRLDTDDDTYPYAFLIYNNEGEYVNTIASNVIDWKQLTDIHGVSNQMGCICLNDGVESLHFINVPSCTDALTLPANVNGRKISSNFDRYVTTDGFQYVIGMGDAEEDADGNVISAIGWFTQEGKLDHYVRFNLGVSGEYFTPLIESYSLDPTLFNTDSQHEYIYIAKLRRTDGSDKIDNVLIVADENGKEIARYKGDDDTKLRIALVVDYNTQKPRLVVGLYSDNTGLFDLSFYNLPLVKFASGGTGTEADPYIISSVGDMKQIITDTKAVYALGADIDMGEVAEAWTPISNFSGQLYGNNHTISNLYLEGNESYAGLFGNLSEGAVIKEVNFKDVEIRLTKDNRYAGILAGMSMHSVTDSIHVNGLKVTASDEASSEFGGLIGQATYFSVFASNSIRNAQYQLPSCSTVGGIVGDTRTSTTVDACLFEGEIVADNIVGGIVGATGKGCTVKNCHVNANLTACNTLGGVVGSASRVGTNNNYVEGSLRATDVDMYGNISLGGIIGAIESDWTQMADTYVVVGNVVNASLDAPADAKAVHSIVGFTIADEQYARGEEHLTDIGLLRNYFISESNDVAAELSPDGTPVKSVDKAFLEGIGFAYGETASAPWKGEGTPMLYFENGVEDGIESIEAETTTSARYADVIYNLAGQRISSLRKGINIVNGRKIMIK